MVTWAIAASLQPRAPFTIISGAFFQADYLLLYLAHAATTLKDAAVHVGVPGQVPRYSFILLTPALASFQVDFARCSGRSHFPSRYEHEYGRFYGSTQNTSVRKGFQSDDGVYRGDGA